MYVEIAAIVESTKALGALIRASTELSNRNDLIAAVSDVSTKLMDATAVALASQERHSALIDEISRLKAEIVQLKDVHAAKEAYVRKNIASGVFAYVVKDSTESMENTHKLCCTCLDQGILSTLQQSREPSVMKGLSCSTCKQKVVFPHYSDQV